MIEAVRTLVPIVLTLVVSLILAVLGWALTEIRKRTRNQNVLLFLERMDKLARTVVLELDQTFVQPLKDAAADGKITKEEIAEAKAKAARRFLELLGTHGRKELEKTVGDAGTAVNSMIEAKVRELRLTELGKVVQK